MSQQLLIKAVSFSQTPSEEVYIKYDATTSTLKLINNKKDGNITLEADNINLISKQKLVLSMDGDYGGTGAQLIAYDVNGAKWTPYTVPKKEKDQDQEDRILELEKKINELTKKLNAFDFEIIEVPKEDKL